jgi:chemotaxis protein MotA
MKAIVGTLIVIGTLLGGYLPHGSFGILFQPLEVLIICGGAIGAYIIANPGGVAKKGLTDALGLVKPAKHSPELYIELLSLLFSIFKKVRKEGLMSIEEDVDNPGDSALFQAYPKVLEDHHAIDFIRDYLRLMLSGVNDPHQIEDLMDLELELHHHEALQPSEAIGRVADGLPAFGIVAAVLGIVVTMSHLDQGPTVIAHHMSVALVGTFLGILFAYGFVAPIAQQLSVRASDEIYFYGVIKSGFVAHLKGSAPQISIEFARKSIPGTHRPSFQQVEDLQQDVQLF